MEIRLNNTAILAERMEQKYELLVQLHDLGVRQLELVRSGDLTQLLKLLSAKQRLLAALQRVERAMDAFRHEPPESRRWESPAARQRCADTVARCELLLQTIVEQERTSEAEMIVRRDEAAARLEGMHHATHVHNAYTADLDYLPCQLDLTQG